MFKQKRSLFIALVAIIFALIFVAMMLDKTMSLALPSGISTAALTLLVTFSVCFVYDNIWLGLLSGVMFGLASWVKALAFGEMFTVNPLVSVLPRIFVGILSFLIYKFVLSLFKNKKLTIAQSTAMRIGTFVGLVANTLLFLTALNICKSVLGKDYNSIWVIIKTVVYTNIIPEYLISLILVPYVVFGVRKGLKLGIDGDNHLRATDDEQDNINNTDKSGKVKLSGEKNFTE